MTRAVIEIRGDIGPVMPEVSKLIEGCAYSPEAPGMAFRVRNMRVVVERYRVLVYNIKDEAAAKAVMDWFVELTRGRVTELNLEVDEAGIPLPRY